MNVFKIIFLASMISGCAGSFVNQGGLDYNRAISKNSQQTLLLNAVRGAKRKPLTFTAIGGLQSDVNRNLSIASPLTFFSGGLTGFNLNSGVDGDLNDRFTYSNLNTAEFNQLIRNPISAADFRLYMQNSVPRDVLFSMAIQNFRIPRNVSKAIWDASVARCENGKLDNVVDRNRCDALKEDSRILVNLRDTANTDQFRQSCQLQVDQITNASNSSSYTYFNDPREQCNFIAYRSFVLALSNLRFRADTMTADSGTWVNQHRDVKWSRKHGEASKTRQTYNSPSPRFILKSSLKSGAPEVVGDGDKTGRVQLRSPLGMINYLGRIIAAKNFERDGRTYNPKIRYGFEFKEAELFDVVAGRNSKAVLSVTDEEGDTFSLIRPKYGATDEARSFNALALLTDIMTRATQRASITSPQGVSVTVN